MLESRPPSNSPNEPSNLGFSLFQIERLLQGELSPAEQAEITHAAESNPKLYAYLQRAQAWTEEAKSLQFPAVLQRQKQANPQANEERFAEWKTRLQGWLRSWQKPAWGMPGMVMASVILLVGVIAIVNLPMQRETSKSQTHFSPKGEPSADMSLEHQGKSHTSGSDLAVQVGDTLRIFYHSSDSLYFQLWSQDNRGRNHPMHAGIGESLPPSSKWLHSGKSLVMESGDELRGLVLIWACSKSDLVDLEARFKAKKKLPEENAAAFHIHSP